MSGNSFEHDFRQRAAREAHYYDHFWADPAHCRLLDVGEAQYAENWDFILDYMGSLEGKRILVVGCGSGVQAVIFARRGAKVVALDVSSAAVEATLRLAHHNGVGERVKGVCASFYDFEGHNQFDIVFGDSILHHLDPLQAGAALRRCVRPGGFAIFSENSARNPILMAGRRFILIRGRFGSTRIGSPDEHPLTDREVETISDAMRSRVERYWPRFVFFSLFTKHRLLKGRKAQSWCAKADQFVFRRLPFLRKYSFAQVVVFRPDRAR